MGADVQDAVDDEAVAGAGRDGAGELGDGGEVAAGEDVLADEVGGFVVGFIALLSGGDVLAFRYVWLDEYCGDIR